MDLVLADVELKTVVGPKIRDHRYVLTTLGASVPDTTEIPREVWNYSKADWARLKDNLREHEWAELHHMDADGAANRVTDVILQHAKVCIGKRVLKEFKSTHPWLTPETVKLTEDKKLAEGKENEKEIIEACSAKIASTRIKYLERTKSEIKDIPNEKKYGVKGWVKCWGKNPGIATSRR